MSEFLQRILLALKARGPIRFIFFVLTRFVRRQSDLLFEIDPRLHLSRRSDFGDHLLCIVDKDQSPETLGNIIVQQLFCDENNQYRTNLCNRDRLFFVVNKESRVLHYSYVQYETRYKKILHESVDVPLISNCVTLPEARGQKLYPKTLIEICHSLAELGCQRVIITCHPDNIASINGIKRSGFVYIGQIESLLLLSRIALQYIKDKKNSFSLRIVSLF